MENQALKYERLAKKHSTIGKVIEECAAYEEIGTVEEFRTLKDKHTPKKPEIKPDKHCDLVQYYYCPTCGYYFGQAGKHNAILFDKQRFCQGENCGQAMDWGEN